MLAVVVAVGTGFGPGIVPVTAGLDSGWQLAMSLARSGGLGWGREVVFTYGPWGALAAPLPLSAALLWQSMLARIVVLALVAWAAFRLGGAGSRRAGLVVAITVTAAAASSGVATAMLLSVALAGLAIALREPEAAGLFGLTGLIAGIGVLVKFNTGCAAVLVGALLASSMPRWRQALAAFFAAAVVGAGGGWLAAGQRFADFAGWVHGSVELSVRYSSAMRHVREDLAGWLPLAALAYGLGMAAVVGALAWSSASRFAPRRAIAITAAAVATAAALYVSSATRLDAGHLGLLPPGLFVLGLPLAVALGERRGDRTISAVATASVALACCGASLAILGPAGLSSFVHPVASIRALATELALATGADARAAWISAAKASIREAYPVPAWELRTLDPPAADLRGPSDAVIDALRGRTTHVEPWAVALAWAHDLPWRPVPTLQAYAAYTPHLDALNERAIGSPEGAEGVLRQSAAVDGKHPLWESPRYQLALLCNFEERASDGRWHALGRVPRRCSPRRLLSRVVLRPGEALPVPDIRGAMIVAELSERSSAEAERDEPLLVRCSGAPYRLSQGLPSGPLVLRAAASGWDARVLPAPCSSLGANRTLEVAIEAVSVR